MNPPPAKSLERHDRADVCPMCFTEILLATNQCPHCGVPVDSMGISRPEPVSKSKPQTLFFEMLSFWALMIGLLLSLPKKWMSASTMIEQVMCVVPFLVSGILAIKFTRLWYQQKKVA